MTTGGMMLDTREFDRALIQYAAASKKDFKDISNKKIYDVALNSTKFVDSADKDVINALKDEKKLIWWFAWRIYIPRGMSKKQAYKAALGLIRRRGKARGFLKGFFRKMAVVMKPFVVDGFTITSRGGKGKFAGFTPYVKPATKQHPNAEVGISYDYEKRSQKTAKKTEQLLLRALRGGMAYVSADMMKYVNRKMGKTAKKFSARRAA